MIFVGYQGVGKSTLANEDLRFVDLESSYTFIDGVRPEGWEKIYVNFALCLSEQGRYVFLSSHKEVRNELKRRKIQFTCIVPKLELKDKWIERLENRYIETKTIKDLKALLNAKEYFEENVKDIIQDGNFQNNYLWYIEDTKINLKNFFPPKDSEEEKSLKKYLEELKNVKD